MAQKSRIVKQYYRPISSNLFITSASISFCDQDNKSVLYSSTSSVYKFSSISSLTGWLIRFTSDCLYKYIIMIPEISQGICFTFGNIRTATDGEPVSPVSISPVSAARASPSLPPHAARASEASEVK